MKSQERARLRAQLNEELGFFPASVDPESAARHRRETAESDADYAAYLLEYGPNGYKRNRWRHLNDQIAKGGSRDRRNR